ncbi:hypothetical protein RIF29_20089 [Crotalaria pallida]|uniref:Uncharacterized protein n=1 Tax=Crotalaria pallida TaxID=3830 RepID=A0AAN9I8B9_CROPI
MMRVGLAHGNSNMMIHPHMHETWDNPNISYLSPPTPSNYPFPKPITDNHCPNLGQSELSDWVEDITKHLVEDLPENLVLPSLSQNSNPRKFTSCTNDPSRSNNSFDLQIQPNTSSGLYHHHHHHHNHSNCNNNVYDQGLNLITLLMECAVAISVDNLGEAHRMLLELTQLASPYKPSCAERIVAYFAKAMSNRVMNSFLGVCSALVDHKSIHSSFQVFNNVSPFIKFSHFTSNQAILEAVNGYESIHIIDLDIMQGLQWPAFFHILATRMEGPPHLTMTGMGTSMELLVETGKQLSNFARRIGLSFKFHPLATKFGEVVDVSDSMVQSRPGEALAVHWLQHSLYDATGPDWKTLKLLERLKPRIITLVEQDVNHGGSFLDRFVGSLHYYSTLFDSLGAYLPSDDAGRHSVEHGLFFREINNILAIGGPARSGEDKFRQWRSELARHCFVQVPMSANSMAQAQLILNTFSPAHGYSLAHVDGTLRLGWKDTSLYTASAWTCSSSR